MVNYLQKCNNFFTPKQIQAILKSLPNEAKNHLKRLLEIKPALVGFRLVFWVLVGFPSILIAHLFGKHPFFPKPVRTNTEQLSNKTAIKVKKIVKMNCVYFQIYFS
jgi:hypothetical protein